MSAPLLQVGVGVLVIVALTVTLVVTRTSHVASGPTPAIIAGAASGVMNAAAGVGGPALSVYAVATRWSQVGFAATAQPYFVAIGVASLVGKLGATGWAVPALDTGRVAHRDRRAPGGARARAKFLSPRISHRAARVAVIAIAYVGGAAALVDGLLDLAG